MRSSFIFFVFLFCFLNVKGQQNFLEVYYPHIDKAEKAIVEDNFKLAIEHYSQAFKTVDNPLARDIYNGVVCNYLIGQNDAAKAWLILLAKKGIDAKVIEMQEVFQEQKVWADWQKFKPVYNQILNGFKPELSQDYKILSDSVNKALLEIKQIYSYLPDQAFELSDEPMTSVDSMLVSKSYQLIDEIYKKIALHASEFILAEGYSTEEQVGISSESLLADGFKSFILSNNFYKIILESKEDTLMDFPKRDLLINLNERLIDAVKKGAIHRDYAIELLKNTEYLNTDYFKLALVPNEVNCGDHKAYAFGVRPSVSTGKSLDFLKGNTNVEKSKYTFFKNEIFLLTAPAEVEEIIVERCEELDVLKENSILLEDIKF